MKTSQWRRMVENRCIFSARLKALSDWSGDHSAGGRRSPAGLVTAKLRCPVAVWVRATSRVPVTADRRCWQHTGVMTIEYSRRGQVHHSSHDRAKQHSSTDQLVVFPCQLGLSLRICNEVDWVGVSSCDSGTNPVMSWLGSSVPDWLGQHQSVGQRNQRSHMYK